MVPLGIRVLAWLEPWVQALHGAAGGKEQGAVSRWSSPSGAAIHSHVLELLQSTCLRSLVHSESPGVQQTKEGTQLYLFCNFFD